MNQKMSQILTASVSSQTKVLQKPIIIIGAGLSGLSLARALLLSKIPFIIYDSSPAPRHHNYGLTLYSQPFNSLLEIYGLKSHQHAEIRALQTKISVNGTARFLSPRKKHDFRVNRGRLESLLREGVNIKFDHKVKNVEFIKDDHNSPLGVNITLNGSSISTDLVIAADGVHSLFRTAQLPNPDKPPLEVRDSEHKEIFEDEKKKKTWLDILSYVVINGSRQITKVEFDEIYAAAFSDRSVVSTSPRPGICLTMSISRKWEEEEVVSLSYVYSRPVVGNEETGVDDKLWNPARAKAEASTIPERFFDELRELEKELEVPYQETFAVDRVRCDRLVSWLMRASCLPQSIYNRLLERGVVLLGDAAFSQPILGGDAGNRAIGDGVECGKFIVDRMMERAEIRDGTREWQEGRHAEEWTGLKVGLRAWAEGGFVTRMEDVRRSRWEIEKMHGARKVKEDGESGSKSGMTSNE